MTTGRASRRRGRAKPEDRPATGGMSGSPGYGMMRLALIQAKLERPSAPRPYIPPEQIAAALRANPGVALPPSVHDYLCDLLEGKVRRPAGRRQDAEQPVRYLKKLLIPIVYARYLAWLQRRERSVGLAGWKPMRNADWWQGPPNERAARMTCRSLRLPTDWRRVQNIVSEATADRDGGRTRKRRPN